MHPPEAPAAIPAPDDAPKSEEGKAAPSSAARTRSAGGPPEVDPVLIADIAIRLAKVKGSMSDERFRELVLNIARVKARDAERRMRDLLRLDGARLLRRDD